MSLDAEKLKKLLTQQTAAKKVVAFFKGTTEAQRKSVAGICIQAQKDEFRRIRGTWEFSKIMDVITLSLYCTSTFKQADKGWQTQVSGELVYEVLLDRKPEWIDEWAQKCCDQLRIRNFAEVFRLAREGHCTKPTGDGYIRLMIDGVTHSLKDGRAKGERLEKVLSNHFEFLEPDIWRVFEVPGVMHRESMRGYLDKDWVKALAKLSKAGMLDRAKLFDRCFSATQMGFNRSQVEIFFQLHDELKPTQEERVAMFDAYVGLLDSQLANVAKWGFEQLQIVDKRQQQDEVNLAGALRPILGCKTKSLVKTAHSWLAAMIKRNPQCTESALVAACEGLMHEKPEVQADTWMFLEKHMVVSQPVLDEVERLLPTTAPSIRKTIKSWLKENSAVSPGLDSTSAGDEQAELDALLKEAKKYPRKLGKLVAMPELVSAIQSRSVNLPPCSFNGADLARLWDKEPLEPISDLQHWVELAAQVIEDGNRVEEAELVLHYMTENPIQGNDECLKTVSPVVQRAYKILKRYGTSFFPFGAFGIHNEVVACIVAWAGDEKQREDFKRFTKNDETEDAFSGRSRPSGWGCMLTDRLRSLFCRFFDDKPVQLLATPTHFGSWLDPVVLAKRLKKVKDPKTLLAEDQVLALLRMAPENRAKALKSASGCKGEFASAFRYACGGTERIGKSQHLWVAAARARTPFDDDAVVAKKFPELGVDCGQAAIYSFRDTRDPKVKPKKGSHVELEKYSEDSPKPCLPRKYDWANPNISIEQRLLPTMIAHEDPSQTDTDVYLRPPESEIIAFLQSCWPQNRESFFMKTGHCDMEIEPLFDPSMPLLECSTHALVVSLSADWAAQRTMAVDLSIEAINDGRWDAARVGRMLGLNLQHATRLAKTLPEIAAASELHSFQVQQAMTVMFASRPIDRPAALGSLLEETYELLETSQIPIQDEAAIEFLSSFSGSSKAAKAAKRILSFEPSGEPELNVIYIQALQGRMQCERKPA